MGFVLLWSDVLHKPQIYEQALHCGALSAICKFDDQRWLCFLLKKQIS